MGCRSSLRGQDHERNGFESLILGSGEKGFWTWEGCWGVRRGRVSPEFRHKHKEEGTYMKRRKVLLVGYWDHRLHDNCELFKKKEN